MIQPGESPPRDIAVAPDDQEGALPPTLTPGVAAESEFSIIKNMLSAGMDPQSTAIITGVSFNRVRGIASTLPRPSLPADTELIESVRHLHKRALAEALLILDTGSDAQRMQLIKSLVNSAAKMAQASNQPQNEDSRVALEQMFVEMREIKPKPLLSEVVDIPVDVETSV